MSQTVHDLKIDRGICAYMYGPAQQVKCSFHKCLSSRF